MYAGRNWKEEEDIREYATLYSPLSDYHESGRIGDMEAQLTQR